MGRENNPSPEYIAVMFYRHRFDINRFVREIRNDWPYVNEDNLVFIYDCMSEVASAAEEYI